ncbi:MAG: TRIC cation channel family protein [Pseudomonadota bacterium]
MDWDDVSRLGQMAGTVAFAVTAVLAVVPQRVSLFTACVMGIITAVGGGTIRDVVTDQPVFWAADLNYIWVALGASVVAFWAHGFFSRRAIYGLMLYLDALGIALFAVQATGTVWRLDFALPAGPVILGVVTAIGGGLMRDVLAGRPTLLMNQEIYALPVLLGSALLALLMSLHPDAWQINAAICFLLIFGMRAAAIRWNWQWPDWLTSARPKE